MLSAPSAHIPDRYIAFEILPLIHLIKIIQLARAQETKGPTLRRALWVIRREFRSPRSHGCLRLILRLIGSEAENNLIFLDVHDDFVTGGKLP